MIKHTVLLEIKRLPDQETNYPEIKDPSIVQIHEKKYLMYASIGKSQDQKWLVGRFEASHPSGPWEEKAPAKILGVSGPELCAPAVLYEKKHGADGTFKEHWTMYIQTACFIENGVIAEAHSEDGETFHTVAASLITKDHIEPNEQLIVGIYDAGISEVTLKNEKYLALVFTGYRKVGCGDLYLSIKKKAAIPWPPAKLILRQENVPFHNAPESEHFEWGLEGGKIIKVDEDCFLLIAVCFLSLPRGFEGHRQRVFLAAAKAIEGPYIPLSIPFQPQPYETGKGEHGHPDAILLDHDLWLIYQERKGDSYPWHLRTALIDFNELITQAKTIIGRKT